MEFLPILKNFLGLLAAVGVLWLFGILLHKKEHNPDEETVVSSGAAVLGALLGAAIGFSQAGIGGVIVGVPVGIVVGLVSGILIFGAFEVMIVVTILAFAVWVVSSLWGVGKP